MTIHTHFFFRNKAIISWTGVISTKFMHSLKYTKWAAHTPKDYCTNTWNAHTHTHMRACVTDVHTDVSLREQYKTRYICWVSFVTQLALFSYFRDLFKEQLALSKRTMFNYSSLIRAERVLEYLKSIHLEYVLSRHKMQIYKWR